jgi:hypothetical protein
MTNATQPAQQKQAKRISPELAEVLHMLKSLEAQPAPKPALQSSR